MMISGPDTRMDSRRDVQFHPAPEPTDDLAIANRIHHVIQQIVFVEFLGTHGWLRILTVVSATGDRLRSVSMLARGRRLGGGWSQIFRCSTISAAGVGVAVPTIRAAVITLASKAET